MDDTQKRIAEIREADRQVADGVVKQWMLAGEWPSELPDFIAAAIAQARASGYAAGVAASAEKAKKRAEEYDALLREGKGEHGKPGYVRDDTWNHWCGQHCEAAFIYDAIKRLQPADTSALPGGTHERE